MPSHSSEPRAGHHLRSFATSDFEHRPSLLDDPGVSTVEQLFQISRAHATDGILHLSFHELVVGRLSYRVKHSDGNWKFGVLHPGQHVCEAGIRGMRVVHEQVGFGDSVAKLNDLKLDSIEANTFVAVFPKDHGLAMLEIDRAILAVLSLGEMFERSIVEDVAVLKYLHERNTLVVGRLREHRAQVLHVNINRATDKRCLVCKRYAQGINRIVNRTLWCRLGLLSKFRRRRILPLRQSINPVVEQNDVDIQVTSDYVHEMIATDAQGIAITRDDPYGKFRTRGLDARGHSRRPAMDAMKSVAVDVVGKSTRTADARNENEVLSRDLEIRQRLLRLRKNGVVSTTRAPPDLLVGHEVLALEFEDPGTLAVLLAIFTH